MSVAFSDTKTHSVWTALDQIELHQPVTAADKTHSLKTKTEAFWVHLVQLTL